MKKKVSWAGIRKALYWWLKDKVDVAMAVICISLGYYDLMIKPLSGAAAFIAFYAVFAAFRVGYMKATIDTFVDNPLYRDLLGLKKKGKE